MIRPTLDTPALFVLLVISLGGLCGCMRQAWHNFHSLPVSEAPMAVATIENPMFVAVADREFLYNQVVDEIDDYFRIQREQRVRLVQGVLMEGSVETYPTAAATLLEPWRKDSTPGFEKLHGTLQSIRRHAQVRMIPTQGGYLLDVAVFKELEDMNQPEHATVGSATLRYDSSLVRDEEDLPLAPGTLGWIPLGRDVSLEQQILANLRGRLSRAF